MRDKILARQVQPGVQLIPGVKNIIAVGSGKGGVGKSTVTANLAMALAQHARVGILDADIYGPSQPHLFGVSNLHPTTVDNKKMKPILAHGIQTMSIGYLIEADTATIWRGPMVSGALQQMLNDTLWEDLDYLLIDLPPGTGDIQLTMAQKIPVTGAVIVTTPQDLALLDARKAYNMFRKVQIDVLGIVENMSTHRCSACGHMEAIFGEGGGDRFARQYDIPLLAQLPLAADLRLNSDQGIPLVQQDPSGAIAQQFSVLAKLVEEKIAEKKQNFASKFPKIVVEKAPLATNH
jgi:ATP-binding protein involved in chromosome partitioning